MRKVFASLCTLVIAWMIAVPAYAQQRAAAPAPAKKPSAPAPQPGYQWRLVRPCRCRESNRRLR